MRAKPKLSNAQQKVCDSLLASGVIGEFQNGKTAGFEVFLPADCFGMPVQREVTRISPATFYALYTIGVIVKDNDIEDKMLPYSRDNWYVLSVSAKKLLYKNGYKTAPI